MMKPPFTKVGSTKRPFASVTLFFVPVRELSFFVKTDTVAPEIGSLSSSLTRPRVDGVWAINANPKNIENRLNPKNRIIKSI